MDPFQRGNRGKDDYDRDNEQSSWFPGISNLTQLSRGTQEHLQRVYGNLTITVAMAAMASILSSHGYIGYPGILALVLMFGGMLAATLLPNNPSYSIVRHGALFGMGFGQGWVAAPLVNTLTFIDPNTVTMAIVATVLIFASFTMSAFYSPRRQYLYLGGLLGTVMTVLMLAGLTNSFLGSSHLFTAELYLGLFAFSFYILYDTQVIVERAEGGSRDPVRNALTLFTDLAAIFIRLLVILSRNRPVRRDSKQKRR